MIKINYIDAILAINSNAQVSMDDNDYNKIIWHNIERIDKITLDAKISELKTTKEQAKTQKEANKASAQAKLSALGLTTEEIKALIGQ